MTAIRTECLRSEGNTLKILWPMGEEKGSGGGKFVITETEGKNVGQSNVESTPSTLQGSEE